MTTFRPSPLPLIYALCTALLLLFECRGCAVDSKVAIKAATTMGFKDPKIVERHDNFVGLFGCDGHDAAAFDIVAFRPGEDRIKTFFTVCVGWPFKGATVRVK